LFSGLVFFFFFFLQDQLIGTNFISAIQISSARVTFWKFLLP